MAAMSERLDLDRLYTLVPAAEEADLLEGLVAERYHEVYETLLFGERSWPLPPPSPAAEKTTARTRSRLTRSATRRRSACSSTTSAPAR
jgi:hypothetical protein